MNVAPIEFAEATGIYLASLFIMIQIVNYAFFKVVPSTGLLLGGSLIVAGATVIYFWK